MLVRNFFYDKAWLKSHQFNLPVIAVGNLSMGGTGKSPMIEYLIRILQPRQQVAVLSRGYGRKTRGYLAAVEGTRADEIGDEPYQFFRKFPDAQIAVDEDRVRGVSNLLGETPTPDVILLDDAYQHRRIKAGLYILLTSFGKLYADDLVLPAGDLREPSSGARRADMVIVSKCPLDLDEKQKESVRRRLRIRPGQELYFTGIGYTDRILGSGRSMPTRELASTKVVLVTGIANPSPMVEYLSQLNSDFVHLEFPDHHKLSAKEMSRVTRALKDLEGDNRLILTTEKDFVRNFEKTELPVYYLPIRTVFLEHEERFKDRIDEYVRKNKRDS
jgi:tetraacyldisaccharide 4'-kinase